MIGLVLSPICALGLLWHQSFIWVVCPQSLVVMFLRQAGSPYDSLSAADYPDLVVGVLYYPVLGWLLSRALKNGTLQRTGMRLVLWHAVALALAFGTAEARNRLWGYGV
jgi:hypothetical protein